MKTHIYAIQWVDHGGPYHEPHWDEQVPTALKQMGYDPDKIIVNIGGLKLKHLPDGCNLFGYIETTTPIPKLDGKYKPHPRWVQAIQLWFSTFEPPIENVEQWYDLYDFESVFYN